MGLDELLTDGSVLSQESQPILPPAPRGTSPRRSLREFTPSFQPFLTPYLSLPATLHFPGGVGTVWSTMFS